MNRQALTFNDTQKIAQFVCVLFYGLTVISVIVAAVSVLRIQELAQLNYQIDSMTNLTNLEIQLKSFKSALNLTLGICYLVWTFKSYQNLTALNATELKHTPFWAVVYWIVPFIQWFMPLFSTIEMYRASSLQYPIEPNNQWKQLPVNPIIFAWFTCFVVQAFLSFRVLSTALTTEQQPTAEMVQQLYYFSTANEILTAFGALLAAQVVKMITRGQFARFFAIHQGRAPFIA